MSRKPSHALFDAPSFCTTLLSDLRPYLPPDNEDGLRVTFADLKIRTKDKRLATLTPNLVQETYLDTLHAEYDTFDWRNGLYVLRGAREDVLKARQQGLSTIWLGLYFLDTINTPLTQTVIMADNGERAELLFRIIHRFYEHLPAAKKRPKKYSNKKEIEFQDIDSIISVGTAGVETAGRGGTVNNVLMSERAFWKNGDDVEIGLMESVPLDGNVTRESTANGLNDYYEERQREHRGESNFKPRFFGWNLTPEYRIAVPTGFERTPEEQKLATAYPLDDGQLAWRRMKIKDKNKGGGVNKFPQEYPICETEAFLSSGNPYFNLKRLADVLMELQTPARACLPSTGRGAIVLNPDLLRLRQCQAEGALQFWEMPREDRYYVVAADTAKGLTQNKGADFCTADVLCVETWEQVATLYGKWEPHAFGLLLADLGWLYGEALLMVERNNHGHAVLDSILYTARYPAQKGNGGSGLYFHDPALLTGQRQSDPQMRQAGWDTNGMTKAFCDDKLAEAIVSAPGLTINDPGTVKECMTYVHKPGGGAGGDGRSHDDRVRSLAIGVAGLNLRFERTRRSRECDIVPVQPSVTYGTRQRGR